MIDEEPIKENVPKLGTFFLPRRARTCRRQVSRDIPVLQIDYLFNRRFKERSDWQIFSAVFSRRNARFFAFHCVKCGSEHFAEKKLFNSLESPTKNPNCHFSSGSQFQICLCRRRICPITRF